MTAPARSIFWFGVYLGSGAIPLILAPRWACALLRVATPDGLWVRLSGMFMLFLGYYCLRAAHEEALNFISWSLLPRALVLPFLLLLLWSGDGSLRLLAFGIFDAFATAWTVRSLAAHRDTVPSANITALRSRRP